MVDAVQPTPLDPADLTPDDIPLNPEPHPDGPLPEGAATAAPSWVQRMAELEARLATLEANA